LATRATRPARQLSLARIERIQSRVHRIGEGVAPGSVSTNDNEPEVTHVADPSFDVVSKIDRQEVDNALNQAAKELANRFDFRGTGTKIQWAGQEAITLESETEERCKAAIEVFKEKLIKRGISLKAFDVGEPASSGQVYRVTGKLVQGIAQDVAKKISKKIRDEAPKGVQAQIQGEQLRVSGKKKDDLQATIQLLKSSDFEVALQFENFR
jgi:cyclic-di-GMP-binding protein